MINNSKIYLKSATSEQWSRDQEPSQDPKAWKGYILDEREVGIESLPSGSFRIKIGDGSSRWEDLKYLNQEELSKKVDLVDGTIPWSQLPKYQASQGISIEDSEIKVKISSDPGNLLELRDDGLYVSVTKVET